MNRKAVYSNERIGKPRVVRDFLPSPADLKFRSRQRPIKTAGNPPAKSR